MPGVFAPRRRRMIMAMLALAIGEASAGICGVPIRFQERDNWCWAGSSEMVRAALGSPAVRQCDDAISARTNGCSAIPAGIDCCGSDTECDAMCAPQIGLDHNLTVKAGPLAESSLRSSPCQLFMFLYLLPGGIPHWRVSNGYVSASPSYLYFNDPSRLLQNQTYMLFEDYRARTQITLHRFSRR